MAAALAVAGGPGVATLATRVAQAAPAGSNNPKAAAKKKLVEGAELLKRREFQAALEHFQSAYELLPSPKIHYNIGLAYMGLGRNAEALEAFHAFLSEATDATGETVTSARMYKESLLQKICRLKVTADVTGALIGVDGKSYGATPRADEILLDAGPHTLVVEKAGVGKPYSKSFDVLPGTSMTLDAKLLPPPRPRVAPRLSMESATAADGAIGAGRSGGGLGIAATSTGADTDTRAKWLRRSGYITGGLALVALALGSTEWVIKEQKYQKFNEMTSTSSGLRICTTKPGYPDHGGPGCASLLDEGDSAKNLGYIGFAAAGALGAASVVLFVIGTRGHATTSTETAFACAPTLDEPGGVCRMQF